MKVYQSRASAIRSIVAVSRNVRAYSATKEKCPGGRIYISEDKEERENFNLKLLYLEVHREKR